MSQKIIPNLWFDHNAQEAVDYYLSVFPEAKIIATTNYPEDAESLPDFQKEFAGKVLTIDFDLGGLELTAINAGSEFKHSEAFSLAIMCKDQEEIDYYWEKLSTVPEAEQCGWCKDKFGISWQVCPANVNELMKSPKAWQVMMNQKKIVISEYED